jgi:thiol-disulfide isomerase/thioredoxin
MVRRSIRRPNRRRRATRKFLRKRSSSVGQIMKPIDIRDKSGLGELIKRIRKGPVTVILVYADWCGHCTEFKPHFNKASQSPNRTVQVASVNDSMVTQMNSTLLANNSVAKPIAVSGYPSVILVDRKGNEVSRVEPIKSTPAMTRVMEESGRIMQEGNSTSLEPIAPASARPKPRNSMVMNIDLNRNNSVPNVVPHSTPKNVVAPKKGELRGEQVTSSMPMVVGEGEGEGEGEEELDATTVVSPPLEEAIIEANSKTMKGGSLFSALGASAYHLAPAGVLMGIASMTLKGKKGRKTRKSHRRY